MIAEGIDDNEPRIKMYYDDQDEFNGDALIGQYSRAAPQLTNISLQSIVYHRPESVKLAIDMLDDSDFRLGQPGPRGPMRVNAADQNYKTQKDQPANSEQAKKKGTAANRDRQKVIKKAEEMNRCALPLSDAYGSC